MNEIHSFITSASHLYVGERIIQTFNKRQKLQSFDDQPAVVHKNTGARSWWNHGTCINRTY